METPQILADFGISKQSSLTDLLTLSSVQNPVHGCLIPYFLFHLSAVGDPEHKLKEQTVMVFLYSRHYNEKALCDRCEHVKGQN